MNAGKYRKRPVEVEVEAVQWNGENHQELFAFFGQWKVQTANDFVYFGAEVAEPGDWLVKDADGAISCLSPHTFDATYEPIPLQGDSSVEGAGK